MSTVQTPWERGTERRIKAASLMFGDSHINTLDTHTASIMGRGCVPV